jgi:hypothetical protein
VRGIDKNSGKRLRSIEKFVSTYMGSRMIDRIADSNPAESMGVRLFRLLCLL